MNEKLEIFGTGITGLVGSRIVELLSDKYKFHNLSLETGVDITLPETLEIITKAASRAVVLHLAAKADVDGCEKDKPLGENGDAWRINVLGTRNVVRACQQRGLPIIYISTDFVFNGENGPYSEEDQPSPINWYGQTKYEGEKIVGNSGLPFTIVRIAYPYRAKFEIKKDFARTIIAKLREGEISAVTDHVMTPTFIDDIAWAIDKLIETQNEGIFHVVGSQFITPYEAAVLIAKKLGLAVSRVKKTTRSEYFKGGAPRPFSLSLKNDKIQKLGVKMKTFQEGLEEI